MGRPAAPRLLAAVTLTGVVGYLSALGTPLGTHIGALWPVGLVSGSLWYGGRSRRVPMTAGLAAVAAAGYLLAGFPVAVTTAYTVGILVEGWVVVAILDRRSRGRGRRSELDAIGILLAVLAGSLVGALLFGATAWSTGFGRPAQVALAVLVAHLNAQLTLLPFFVHHSEGPSPASRGEQVARWLLVVAVTSSAFTLTSRPTLLFLTLPLLAWTALRATVRETLWTLVVMSAIAHTLTSYGRGPFAALARSGHVARELAVLPDYTFLLGCTLVSVPFALAAGRERARAHDVVRQQARYERLFGSSGSVMVECDAIGRILMINARAEELLGWTNAEVVGRFPDLFHSEEEIARQAEALGCEPTLMDVSLACVRPDEVARDWRFRCRDGSELTMLMQLSAITDEGEVIGYLATAEDVTERARAEESLAAALGAERAALSRLREVDLAKDAFVSSVSHELRTPITNIVGYLELLVDGSYGEPTEPQAEALARIEGNSQRLLELIDDLLLLSAVESMDVSLHSQPIDLRDVAREVVSRVRPQASQRDQSVELVLPEMPAVVGGDPVQLQRMLGNLAGNAVKFTPAGGHLAVRVLAEQGSYVLEVEDDGIGIAEDEQKLVFNRFYRTQYVRSEAIQGSGLGLSLARSIAHLHGARISAHSRPGQGSRFRVSFDERSGAAVLRLPRQA